MSDHDIIPQPFSPGHRSELRLLFQHYLRAEKDAPRYTWESLTAGKDLPHPWIYDLYEDSRDRLWVGTWGGGLACCHAGTWQTYTSRQGLHCDQVTCIREDPKGLIWVATDNGLNYIDGGAVLDGGLPGKSLLNLTFDQHGFLWAGCWRADRSGGGLYRFDGHDWESFTRAHPLALPGLEILKVFCDSRGRIWIGTYDQGIGAGIGCYDGHAWQSYTTSQGLVNNCVYSMFEDPAGNMWFGTLGGISIFDGTAWNTLTSRDGLIDNRIYCMFIDSNRKMWFGTERGVSRFDGSTWVSFTKKDGLVEDLVRTIIERRDGSLWFGTYPYAAGAGGISIARLKAPPSLTDRLLDLLPEPPTPGSLPPPSS